MRTRIGWSSRELREAQWAVSGGGDVTASQADIRSRVLEDAAMKRFVRNEELHMTSARSLDALCPRPLEGEQWRVVTEKSFNAYAFIRSLLKDGDVLDLHLAIYRINEPTVRALCQLIDQARIRRATFIISSFFNQTRRPEVWAQALAAFCADNPECCRFAYLHNHAKVVCVRNAVGCYVFEGSGNMSDNARIEQYTYECNREVYAFHCAWMDRLVEAANPQNTTEES